MKSISRFIYPLAAVFWTAVVFYACLMPSSDVPTVPWLAFPMADKLIHIVLFGVLCWLYWRAFLSASGRYERKWLIIAATLSIGIGILIECLQAGMANGRSFEVTDILADALASIGVALGVYALRRGNNN